MFQPDASLADEHRRWLKGFGPQHLINWEKLLNSDPEAAMCEAQIRSLLANSNVDVKPSEDLAGDHKAPDFLCERNKEGFYVEVTCISIDKATNVTGLIHPTTPGSSGFRPLNDAIFEASRQKTPQCADKDLPCLVAVGTFHFDASCICVQKFHMESLLTGEPLITHDIDTATGQPIGETYETTRLRSATFLRPDREDPMSHARNPISGMLICGLGCHPPNLLGVLHPSPVREFDRRLLPDIEFCRLSDGYEFVYLRGSGQLERRGLREGDREKTEPKR